MIYPERRWPSGVGVFPASRQGKGLVSCPAPLNLLALPGCVGGAGHETSKGRGLASHSRTI